jgi:hypothetical protein
MNFAQANAQASSITSGVVENTTCATVRVSSSLYARKSSASSP